MTRATERGAIRQGTPVWDIGGGHSKKSGVGCARIQRHVEEGDMKFERARRTVVLTVIIALLCVGTRPRPARAVETAVLVIGSIAAYVGFVVGGAILMRPEAPASSGFVPMEQPLRDARAEPGVHFAHRCNQDSPNLKLVCW